MSSCDVPVIYVHKGMTPDELWEELQPILADECDHGEDDPCRSETEGPADDE